MPSINRMRADAAALLNTLRLTNSLVTRGAWG